MLNGVFSFTVASKKNKKKRGNANERAHSWGRGWRNGRRKKPLRTFVFIECLKWRKIRCLFPVANVVFFLYSPSSLHHTDPPPFCATFHRIVFPPPNTWKSTWNYQPDIFPSYEFNSFFRLSSLRTGTPFFSSSILVLAAHWLGVFDNRADENDCRKTTVSVTSFMDETLVDGINVSCRVFVELEAGVVLNWLWLLGYVHNN